MKVLITGGASGIAYLTALTLAERNHDVYLSCHTKEEVNNVSKKVSDYKNIKVLKIDITDSIDRKKALSLNVDVLFNNASVAQGGSLLEANINDVRNSFEVNVFSFFSLTQDILKQMVKKNKGRIIMMSSLIAMAPLPFTSIYSSTKASISIIGTSLGLELKLIGKDVDIIIVQPGMYHTGFNDVLLDSKYNDGEYFKDIKDNLYKYEHLLFKLGEAKELDKIVIQIVRAVEDAKPKRFYRSRLFQNLFTLIYHGIINK